MVEHAVVKLYDGAFVDAGVAVDIGSVKPFPRLNGDDVLRAEKSNIVRHGRTAFERLRRRLQKRFDLRRPAFEIVGKLDCGYLSIYRGPRLEGEWSRYSSRIYGR